VRLHNVSMAIAARFTCRDPFGNVVELTELPR